jgi:hypothetical protein
MMNQKTSCEINGRQNWSNWSTPSYFVSQSGDFKILKLANNRDLLGPTGPRSAGCTSSLGKSAGDVRDGFPVHRARPAHKKALSAGPMISNHLTLAYFPFETRLSRGFVRQMYVRSTKPECCQRPSSLARASDAYRAANPPRPPATPRATVSACPAVNPGECRDHHQPETLTCP